MEASLARRLWLSTEPIHALVYFEPSSKPTYESIGLKGGWMGYFASRGAALGPVPPEVIVATYYNFAPRMVERAIPDAWSLSGIEDILDARLRVADAGLKRGLGDDVKSEPVLRCAELARRAATGCRADGRALFAAHASLPWPEAPHLVLWHALTLLREHRGDGHVAALVAHDVSGIEANVLLVAAGLVTEEYQRKYRGWTAEEWADAAVGLRSRGLLDDTGGLTPAGRELRATIEDLTDRLALQPYETLGEGDSEALATLAAPLSRAIDEVGVMVYPNPMGLPRSA